MGDKLFELGQIYHEISLVFGNNHIKGGQVIFLTRMSVTLVYKKGLKIDPSRIVPSAYRPRTGISNPEGSIYKPFTYVKKNRSQLPQPIGLRPGSQIQKGLYSDPPPTERTEHSFLRLSASDWDFKSERVYFQTFHLRKELGIVPPAYRPQIRISNPKGSGPVERIKPS